MHSSEMNCVQISLENSTVKQSPEICTKELSWQSLTDEDVVDSYNGLVSQFKGCIANNYNLLSFHMIVLLFFHLVHVSID